VYVWRSLLVGPVAALIIVFPLSLAATLCSAVFSTAHFRPPPVHHSPLSLSPSSSVLAAAHFPSSSAAGYKPSLRFRIYLTILSSIDSSLTPLLVHAHTLRDAALLLLLLLLHRHQKQHTCFLSSSSPCLCVFLHSNFILT